MAVPFKSFEDFIEMVEGRPWPKELRLACSKKGITIADYCRDRFISEEIRRGNIVYIEDPEEQNDEGILFSEQRKRRPYTLETLPTELNGVLQACRTRYAVRYDKGRGNVPFLGVDWLDRHCSLVPECMALLKYWERWTPGWRTSMPLAYVKEVLRYLIGERKEQPDPNKFVKEA